jgi:hypothetical protein
MSCVSQLTRKRPECHVFAVQKVHLGNVSSNVTIGSPGAIFAHVEPLADDCMAQFAEPAQAAE